MGGVYCDADGSGFCWIVSSVNNAAVALPISRPPSTFDATADTRKAAGAFLDHTRALALATSNIGEAARRTYADSANQEALNQSSSFAVALAGVDGQARTTFDNGLIQDVLGPLDMR